MHQLQRLPSYLFTLSWSWKQRLTGKAERWRAIFPANQSRFRGIFPSLSRCKLELCVCVWSTRSLTNTIIRLRHWPSLTENSRATAHLTPLTHTQKLHSQAQPFTCSHTISRSYSWKLCRAQDHLKVMIRALSLSAVEQLVHSITIVRFTLLSLLKD